MPFTLSHAAAVIPVKRYFKHANLSALVIGSMVPDLVYFLSLGVSGKLTHSLTGLILFCIPAGMAAYFIFHLLVKRPLFRLLPYAIRIRLTTDVSTGVPRTLKAFLVLVGSLVAGGATHIVWDSFTHANTFFTGQIAWLQMAMPLNCCRDVDLHLPVYKLLQHASTLAGLGILFISLHKWFKAAPIVQPDIKENDFGLRTAILALFFLSVSAGFLTGLATSPATSLERMVFHATVKGMQWLVLAVFLYCGAMQLRLICLEGAKAAQR